MCILNNPSICAKECKVINLCSKHSEMVNENEANQGYSVQEIKSGYMNGASEQIHLKTLYLHFGCELGASEMKKYLQPRTCFSKPSNCSS